MLTKLRDGFFLVGVAHILPKSMQDVREVIEREKPEVVAVELDETRYAMLTGFGRAAPAEVKTKHSVSILGGLIGLLQTKFSRQTGMQAGEEMLVAIDQAMRIGANIKLIDQDINVTLNRINEQMPMSERIWLMFQLFISIIPSRKKVKLENITEDQVVHNLVNEFRRLSPTTHRVLIEERDDYMSSAVLPLLTSGRRVVCVVGAGHVPGIQRRLEEALRETREKNWWASKIEFEYGD